MDSYQIRLVSYERWLHRKRRRDNWEQYDNSGHPSSNIDDYDDERQ